MHPRPVRGDAAGLLGRCDNCRGAGRADPCTPAHLARCRPRRSSAVHPAAQPRIGLALSGGGARGIAHVGVLKVLEEMRIPIHCVTGTSMGAIVGGTFAAGTLAGEAARRPCSTADWDDDLPRPAAARGNRDPAQGRRLQDAVRAGIRRQGRQLALPKGVIAGVSIESFFRVLADAGVRHRRLQQAAHPVPGDGHRHRDRRLRRARPTAASRRRCAPACRCRARSRRSRSTAGCWSTAASPTTCRSTKRASCARDVDHRRQHLDAAAEARARSRRR